MIASSYCQNARWVFQQVCHATCSDVFVIPSFLTLAAITATLFVKNRDYELIVLGIIPSTILFLNLKTHYSCIILITSIVIQELKFRHKYQQQRVVGKRNHLSFFVLGAIALFILYLDHNMCGTYIKWHILFDVLQNPMIYVYNKTKLDLDYAKENQKCVLEKKVE